MVNDTHTRRRRLRNKPQLMRGLSRYHIFQSLFYTFRSYQTFRLTEISSIWILEPSSCFTKHWSVLVRPHVEYANSIWSPYKKGDTEAIEKIQKRATKLVISLKKLPYKERLLQLNLHTLKYRREIRGDMIEVYKITHDMYDRSVALELPRNASSIRGNKYKLQNHSFHYGSVPYRPQTISATNHIGHDHIGHTKRPYRPKGITMSATKKCTAI